MTSQMNSIIIGISNFPFFAVIATLPILAVTIMKYKSLNFMRIGLNYAMILYGLCLAALVFLPLPTMEKAATLHTHDIQWVPFHFIVDIIKESPLKLSNPATYMAAIRNRAVLQVVFNVLMLVPFGMFLRYYKGYTAKKIILVSFGLSLFIEITQLTGIYGIYHGSYRLCDMDDLIANTLGGFLGCHLIGKVERIIPTIEAFDLSHLGVQVKSQRM